MAQDKTQNLFTEITTEESSTVNGGCGYYSGYRSYGYRQSNYGYRPRYNSRRSYYSPRYRSASYGYGSNCY
ncbi:MAG: hypothetical protein WBA13_15905 [Microcoleaceae cyanobacterium]